MCEDAQSRGGLVIGPVSPRASSRIANTGLVAALMVVFIHVDIQPDTPSYVRWIVGIVKVGTCTCAVPSFFAIAGYLLAGHVGESGWWGRALRKRIVTLGVPYLLWGTMFFFFDYFRTHDMTLVGFLNSLGFTTCEMPGLYPLWFVRSLFALVVVSPVLVRALSLMGKGLLVGLFALVLIGPVVQNLEVSVIRIASSVFAVFGGMFYFALGLYVRLHGKKLDLSFGWQVLLGLVGIILTVLGAVGELRGLMFVRAYCLSVGVPLLMLGLWGLIPSVRWPKWLTSCAFPIFLLHVFAIGVYNNFLVRDVSGVLAFAAKYAFSVGLPIVAVVVMRRMLPKVAELAFGGR